ncbi:hypothetical protein OH807_20495 [Kitasatospora sp. NBC_01560]|uniref:hypothetical protein n=1 Tax=Kitasatospora sp. NBC_01560 TaxID=2975965 RepID=UPI003865276B
MSGAARAGRGTRGLLAALAAAALLAAAGCAGDSAAAPDGATATGPHGEPLIALTDDVRQPYLSYWDDYVRVFRAADPQAPGLEGHADEPNLSILRASLQQLRQDGQRMQGDVRHRLLGMQVRGELYQVYDCVDLDSWRITDAATGRETDQVGRRPEQLAVMTMRQVDGRWKVTDVQRPVPCPSASPAAAPSGTG